MDIVWVNGCFDLLHFGHIEMLKYARGLGDALHVGIDSDVRIQESKGPTRPYQNQETRLSVLKSLSFVDKASIFDTSWQLGEYIRQANPKVMVIGEEYKGKDIIGAQYVQNIVYFPRIEGFSTTSTIEKLRESL